MALAEPASSSLALSLYTGRLILAAHALPTVLGAQSFTAPLDRWFPQGWISAVMTWLVYRDAGYPGLVAGNIALAALALVLVEERCRARRLSDEATALALALAIFASLGVLRVGGATADLAFAAAFFACLDRHSGTWVWAGVPLTLLWANVSPVGLIAPPLAACALLGTLIDERAISARVRTLAVFTAAVTAAAIATPATYHSLLNYAVYLDIAGGLHVQAWQPVRVSAPAFFAGFVPGLIFCAWLGLRRKGSAAEIAVTLATVTLALLHGKYLGIAALALTPILAAALDDVVTPSSKRLPQAFSKAAVAGIAAVVALGGAFVSNARGTQALDGGRDQYAAIDRLAADGHPHRLFCYNPTWCNYALLRGAPSVQVFLDGREEAYPPSIRTDSVNIVLEQTQWLRHLKKWNIDTVVTTKNSISLLALLPHWTLLPASGDVVVYERR